uniref:hypothetical protein n=1 Tax=Nonomuraea pusilla TaxID=46177 RepID=UPI0006E320CB|nr:hypothetical protein [Nonomuraea pusilla]
MTSPAATRMPLSVRGAGLLMTLQLAFGLVALGVTLFALVAATATEGPPLLLLLAYAPSVAVLALTGRLIPRLGTRHRRVRLAAVALQAAAPVSAALLAVLDQSADDWTMLLAQHGLLPAATAVLLLSPAASHWFGR